MTSRTREPAEHRDHITVLDWALLHWAYNFSKFDDNHPVLVNQRLLANEGISVSKLVRFGMLNQYQDGRNKELYKLTAHAIREVQAIDTLS